MMTVVTILFFAGTLGVALYLNSYLDKREDKKSGK
jgi:hypothetical protein